MTVKLPELWLQYASDDVRGAKILLAEKIYNISCFHSQQAAAGGIYILFKSVKNSPAQLNACPMKCLPNEMPAQ